MVELQRRGILKCLVSQNCDGLHLRSGISPSCLAELHGNMNLETCSKCGAKYLRDYDAALGLLNHLTGRKCDKLECATPLKDSIINFGENLPADVLFSASDNLIATEVSCVVCSR